jgi:hypothetical protein
MYGYNATRAYVGLHVFPNLLSSSEFLPLASASDSDVYKAIKRLRPSKSVGVDDIPGFIIKGCTDIFVPILKHIVTCLGNPRD